MNEWSLWFFPRDIWAGVLPCVLVDPARRLRGLREGRPELWSAGHGPASVIVATDWLPEVETAVARGGEAVLLQSEASAAGPVPIVELPFWREAIKLVEPHPAWGDFPHDGSPGLQFYGCATDCALDTSSFGDRARPILRRLDARTMALHDYAIELAWGRGRMIVSTLRFEGGLGDQPSGIASNTAAAYLFACWVRYLQGADADERR